MDISEYFCCDNSGTLLATDKVKELIKTSGSNVVDVEIHSVTLL